MKEKKIYKRGINELLKYTYCVPKDFLQIVTSKENQGNRICRCYTQIQGRPIE